MNSQVNKISNSVFFITEIQRKSSNRTLQMEIQGVTTSATGVD